VLAEAHLEAPAGRLALEGGDEHTVPFDDAAGDDAGV
jgi:hypothetical protein